MTMMTVEISAGQTQNREPYVDMHFGPEVPFGARDHALSMAHGYGMSCGWGPGPIRDAVVAAGRLATRLRKLGWSVSVID